MNKLTEKQEKLIPEISRKLQEYESPVGSDGYIYKVDGSPKVTVVLSKDGQYRKKPIVDEAVAFSSIYVGAKKTPIFVFSLKNQNEFKCMELSLTEIDSFLSDFVVDLCGAFKIDDAGKSGPEIFSEVLKIEGKLVDQKKKDDAKDTKNDLDAAMKNNPLYGSF